MKTTKELPRVMSFEYDEDLLNPKPNPEKVTEFDEGFKKAILDFIKQHQLNQQKTPADQPIDKDI